MCKILYINLDGFSYSYYSAAKKAGKTNIFDSLAKDGMIFTKLNSGVISITNPMQGAILSGAWSNKTHNFYQHYDKAEKKIVKHYRANDAQNIADCLLSENKTAVSIHQFMLEHNPCEYGIKNRAYFKSDKQQSNYKDRFDILNKIILKEPLKSGGKEIIYDEFPDFIALYIDDLDALGHNNDYDGYPKRKTLKERQNDIVERIEAIQCELLNTVKLLKSQKIYDHLVVLITTDHGMTKFEGKSLITRLLNEINSIGIKADLACERNGHTEIALLPYTVSCSVYYDKILSEDKKDKLRALFESLDYLDKVFDYDTLINCFKMDNRAPDFLLFPKPYGHFYHKDFDKGFYGASHDSYDETSQHIFGMLSGANVKKLQIYGKKITSIDLLPSVLYNVHKLKMRDSTGKIYTDLFEE